MDEQLVRFIVMIIVCVVCFGAIVGYFIIDDLRHDRWFASLNESRVVKKPGLSSSDGTALRSYNTDGCEKGE